MNIYQKILQFYLGSGLSFNDEMNNFFEDFEHKGKCENRKYYFESEIYRNHIDRLCDLPYHQVMVNLTDEEIKEYFTKHYTHHQLFAIIFAHWFKLSQKQIFQIKNIRNKYKCLDLLNYFLWNPEKEEYPTEQVYIYANFNQEYHVFDNNTEKEIAVCKLVHDNSDKYSKTYLINEELELKFEVDEG